MRAVPAVLASMACAALSCGRMADGNYRQQPLAVVQGTLRLESSHGLSGPVLMALAWEPAAASRKLFVESAAPEVTLGSGSLTCSAEVPTQTPCDGTPWSGRTVCRSREELPTTLAEVLSFQAHFLGGFSVQIEDLPPTGARYDLARQGGRGSLALGALVALVDDDADGQIRFGTPERPPEVALASSACQDYVPTGGGTRVSYQIAFLDGAVAGAGVSENYGALRELPPGYSLWAKTEEVDAGGNSLSARYAVLPIDDARIELHGYASNGGLDVWCTDRVVEEVWVASLDAVERPFECVSENSTFTCEHDSVAGPCHLVETRHQVATACGPLPPPPCVAGGWVALGPAPTRFLQAAPLASGMVLALSSEAPSTAAGLVDPTTGIWWTTGSLAVPRSGASLTVLPSGKVLAAGGLSGVAADDRSAEIYDPMTWTWAPTGSMATARALHSATLLPDGSVLVVGGRNVESAANLEGVASAEIYDPAAGTWRETAPAPAPRHSHTAIYLPAVGRVLVTGSRGGPEADLYDPANETWRPAASMLTPHQHGSFTLLGQDRVLALGGFGADQALAEVYDSPTDSWTQVAPMPLGRWGHGAVALGGQVLVMGGETVQGELRRCLSDAWRYDPLADEWTAAASLPDARSWFTSLVLTSGAVFITPGEGGCRGSRPSALLYCEPPVATGQGAAGAPAPSGGGGAGR